MQRVFITRALKETDFFKTALEKVGFVVFGQSLIQFSPVVLEAIPTCDWLFFYSKNGVRFFFQAIDNQSIIDKKIGTIGESTAHVLEQEFGIKADFIGTGDPLQTAKDFELKAKNETVLFPRAEQSKKSIQEQLGKTIITKDLIVYKNEPVTDFEIVAADILVFTSPLNVKVYFDKVLLQPEQVVIAIGQTTAKYLQDIGIQSIISNAPNENALVEAVLKQVKFS